MEWFNKIKTAKVIVISFILAGVLIGIMLVAQFQSPVTANSYLIDELNAQKELLNSFDEDRNSLKEQIVLTQGKLDELRSALEISGKTSNLGQLEELKIAAGLSKIKGKGLRIILGDGTIQNQEKDANLVHASDLRDLINILRTARVDGISLNGQRIISLSTINSLGNTILVNKVKMAGPFEINVIGNTEMVVNRINDQKSYPDLYNRIKNRNVSFEMQKLDQVILAAYDSDFLFKYAQTK
jgi:uncharacterized protein YlxW (UPF0749 family)